VLDDFPEIGGPEDIAAALAATAAGVADGVISADEAMKPPLWPMFCKNLGCARNGASPSSRLVAGG
jgi:hypothetical protein